MCMVQSEGWDLIGSHHVLCVHMCIQTHRRLYTCGVVYLCPAAGLLVPMSGTVVLVLRLLSLGPGPHVPFHQVCLVSVSQIIAQKPCDVQCATEPAVMVT